MISRFAACLLFVAVPFTAQALDARFSGAWRIESAQPAPWAKGGDVDARETKQFVGKSVVFGDKALSAPKPLGCKPARYSISEGDGPEMLFEGGLAEPDASGKLQDAAALARKLGLTTPKAATLEASCSEVKFHVFAPDTLAFALDNQIYTMKRAEK